MSIIINKILALETDANEGTMVSLDDVLAIVKQAALPEATADRYPPGFLDSLKVSDRVVYGTLEGAYELLRYGAVHASLMASLEDLKEANPGVEMASISTVWEKHVESFDPEVIERSAPDEEGSRYLLQQAFQILYTRAEGATGSVMETAIGGHNERVAQIQREQQKGEAGS